MLLCALSHMGDSMFSRKICGMHVFCFDRQFNSTRQLIPISSRVRILDLFGILGMNVRRPNERQKWITNGLFSIVKIHVHVTPRNLPFIFVECFGLVLNKIPCQFPDRVFANFSELVLATARSHRFGVTSQAMRRILFSPGFRWPAKDGRVSLFPARPSCRTGRPALCA